MTLRTKFAVGLLTIAVILVIPLVMAMRSLSGLYDGARTLKDRELTASLLLGTIRGGLDELEKAETNVLFNKKPADRDAMATLIAVLGREADSLEGYRLTDAARVIHSSVEEIAKWAPAEYDASLANLGKRADSISHEHIGPALALADSSVHVGEAELDVRTAKLVDLTTSDLKTTRATAMGGLLFALAIAATIAVWFARSITRPVTALEHGMRAVADGDLTIQLKLDQTRKDEFGQLARSFDAMTRQLSELDKLKAEFISVASHELKTPVNVIIGYLQLLDEGVYGPMSPKQLDVHKTLEAQAQSLLRLTRQLLDVSRFEAGGGRLDIRRIVLGELFDDLERSFHVLAVQREVTFTLHRHAGLPADVYWDLDRVNEVLGNLLTNAFKFTPRGGAVDLIAEPVDGSVRIIVKDTGAGIPPDQVHRIFEKFYQADNQGSTKSKGSGLGLAIAKSIVDAHGGTISCESTLGVGTSFTIVVPSRVARRSSSHHAVPVGVA